MVEEGVKKVVKVLENMGDKTNKKKERARSDRTQTGENGRGRDDSTRGGLSAITGRQGLLRAGEPPGVQRVDCQEVAVCFGYRISIETDRQANGDNLQLFNEQRDDWALFGLSQTEEDGSTECTQRSGEKPSSGERSAGQINTFSSLKMESSIFPQCSAPLCKGGFFQRQRDPPWPGYCKGEKYWLP